MSRTCLVAGPGVVAVFISGIANAICSAPPPKVCSAYFQADVVVRGRVLSEKRDADWIHYSFKVNKTFKGRQLPVRSFYTGNDSGRLDLDVGSEYVLFAFRDKGRFALTCNEYPLSTAAAVARVSLEIAQLRASKATDAIIEGQILAANYSSPLPGVPVTASGRRGQYTAVSNRKGYFSMRVPPGQYRVTVNPAVAHQTIYSRIYVNPQSIHLAPGQCAQFQYRGGRR